MKIDALALHLAPNAVDMLGPTADLGADPLLHQCALQLGDDLLQGPLAVRAALVQLACNVLVALRVQEAERKIL